MGLESAVHLSNLLESTSLPGHLFILSQPTGQADLTGQAQHHWGREVYMFMEVWGKEWILVEQYSNLIYHHSIPVTWGANKNMYILPSPPPPLPETESVSLGWGLGVCILKCSPGNSETGAPLNDYFFRQWGLTLVFKRWLQWLGGKQMVKGKNGGPEAVAEIQPGNDGGLNLSGTSGIKMGRWIYQSWEDRNFNVQHDIKGFPKASSSTIKALS